MYFSRFTLLLCPTEILFVLEGFLEVKSPAYGGSSRFYLSFTPCEAPQPAQCLAGESEQDMANVGIRKNLLTALCASFSGEHLSVNHWTTQGKMQDFSLIFPKILGLLCVHTYIFIYKYIDTHTYEQKLCVCIQTCPPCHNQTFPSPDHFIISNL